jgi:hypothetical protein
LLNVDEFIYLGSMITNDARCTREIKARIAMAKAAFNRKKTLYTSKLDLELRKKLVKCYIWSIALYGVETRTLRKLDQKYLETFDMWCWRRMAKISWTDRVNNEAVLHRVKKERNILHTIRRRKANWFGHILHRNCLLSHIVEGNIIGTRRQGRRCKQLLDDLKEARRYWKLKEEAQDRTLRRTHVSLEEAIDLSQDRLLLDLTFVIINLTIGFRRSEFKFLYVPTIPNHRLPLGLHEYPITILRDNNISK